MVSKSGAARFGLALRDLSFSVRFGNLLHPLNYGLSAPKSRDFAIAIANFHRQKVTKK